MPYIYHITDIHYIQTDSAMKYQNQDWWFSLINKIKGGF